MGYNDYPQPDPDGIREPQSMIQTIIGAIARIVGLAVLLVGLWVGFKVILEAWALYESPERIERFAVAIENGSNLDKIFSDTVERMSSQVMAKSAADEPRISSDASPQEQESVPPLRLSYFAAWFIVMMLMLIIGSLAMSAISAGGKLALYDTEVRKYSREVVREFSRLKRAA